MENRANYFFVGLFVFGVFFASLACILWLGGYSKEESFEYYKIHTQESVAGLSVKAPVRLLGVEVGNVESIDISEENDLSVDVLIKVKRGTPIKEDTFATLQLQGITGLKFVQLEGGSREAARLKAKEDEIPVIKFKESLFAAIDKESEHLFSLIKTADRKSKELLNEANLRNFERILYNLAQISENFNKTSHIFSENLVKTTIKLGKMSDEVANTAKKLNASLRGVDKGVRAFENFSKKASNKLDFYDELRYELKENLELFKVFLLESNALILDLQKSPSDLIFKASKPKLGPGEKE